MNITNTLIFVKSGRQEYTNYLIFFLCSSGYLKRFLIFLSALPKASDSQYKSPNLGDLLFAGQLSVRTRRRGGGSRFLPQVLPRTAATLAATRWPGPAISQLREQATLEQRGWSGGRRPWATTNPENPSVTFDAKVGPAHARRQIHQPPGRKVFRSRLVFSIPSWECKSTVLDPLSADSSHVKPAIGKASFIYLKKKKKLL